MLMSPTWVRASVPSLHCGYSDMCEGVKGLNCKRRINDNNDSDFADTQADDLGKSQHE